MSSPDRIARLIEATAGITVVSGTLQALAPGFVLARSRPTPGTVSTPAERQFFAAVGAFDATSNGALFQAVSSHTATPGLLAWAAAQKFAAAGVMLLGLRRKALSPRVLPVVAFDVVGGLACLRYRQRLTAPGTAAAGRAT